MSRKARIQHSIIYHPLSSSDLVTSCCSNPDIHFWWPVRNIFNPHLYSKLTGTSEPWLVYQTGSQRRDLASTNQYIH